MASHSESDEEARSTRPTAGDIERSYVVYDLLPIDEPDEWGDLASFRAAAAASHD